MWTKQEILNELDSIVQALKEKRSLKLRMNNSELLHREMKQRFDEFSERYPEMFRKVITEGDAFNLEKMHEMLSMYEQVRLGEVTNEAMSERIGQQEFDQYVKPAISGKRKYKE